LKLKYDEALLKLSFYFNLRRCSMASKCVAVEPRGEGKEKVWTFTDKKAARAAPVVDGGSPVAA